MVENHETYRQGSPICWEIMKCINNLLAWAFCKIEKTSFHQRGHFELGTIIFLSQTSK
jgi:hypothetical protein